MRIDGHATKKPVDINRQHTFEMVQMVEMVEMTRHSRSTRCHGGQPNGGYLRKDFRIPRSFNLHGTTTISDARDNEGHISNWT